MWLICGLGNPGKKYQYTRHNIGFLFIDALIKKNDFQLIKKDKSKLIYRGSIKDTECLFCKPLTYMNLSGLSIREVISFYKISKSNLIVAHDDLDLSVGKIKIKIGGGNGGHNGLANIDQIIGIAYKRLRIGIGHPGLKELVDKYVLEKFKKDEKEVINQIIELSVKNIYLLLHNKELFLTKIASQLKKIS